MKKSHRTIVMVIVGLVVCVVIVGGGTAIWFFTSAFETVESDEATAARAFDEVGQRFSGASPIIEIRGKEAVVTRTAPDAAPPGELHRVMILTWEPDGQSLSRITLPWWLIRMKETPFDLGAEIGSGFSGEVTVSVDDIERYGPALFLQHAEQDGSRVAVWTE